MDSTRIRLRVSRAHDAKGLSPHYRDVTGRQGRLSRPRHTLRTAAVRVVEVASRRSAGLRSLAIRRAAVPPVQGSESASHCPGIMSWVRTAAVLTARLTGWAVSEAWWLVTVRAGWLACLLGPVSPVPTLLPGPLTALPSRTEAEPSRSRAGVRCLVPSCHRSGPHPDPATRRSSLR